MNGLMNTQEKDGLTMNTTKHTTKKMACYCRVSTDKEEQLQSLAKQKEYFGKFASDNGYELYGIYADEGISGKQVKKRIKFQEMLEDARLKKFEVVAVKDISRFSRNTVDFLKVVRELKSIGVKVLFTNNNLGSDDPEFVLTVLVSIAQEESLKLSERVKFGKAINAKKGRVPNFVFGYNKVDTFTLEINEYEANTVRKMYELFLEEGYGTLKIAEYLNKNGVLTKKQQRANWYQKTVIDILRNPIYTGKIVNGKTEVADFITEKRRVIDAKDHIVVERPELRIVSDEDYKKVQMILKERSKSFNLENKRESTKYPFSNLIKCADCGYTFRRRTRQYSKGGKVYKRWCCSIRNAKGKDACINKSVIDEDILLGHIREYLKELIATKESFIKLVIKEVETLVSDMTRGIDLDESQLKKQYEELRKERKKYIKLYAKSSITEEELDECLLPVDKEIEKVKLQLAHIIDSTRITSSIGEEVRTYFKNIDKLLEVSKWSNMDLKQLIEEIQVSHTGDVKVKLKMLSEQGMPLTVPFNIDSP